MCRSEVCSLPAPVLPPADMPSHQLIKPMKPRLPRKLAASARINLNRYWHALEDLMPVSRKTFDESDNNAINENIDNERRLAAMRLSDSPGRSFRSSPPSPMADISTSNIHQNIAITSNNSSFPKISSERLSFSKAFEDNTFQQTSSGNPSSLDDVSKFPKTFTSTTMPSMNENIPPSAPDCPQ